MATMMNGDKKRRKTTHPCRAAKGKLLAAAKRCDAKAVKTLLEQTADLTSINQKDKDGNTALMIVAGLEYGQLTIIDLLLADDRVDRNAVNQKGHTALMIAAEKWHNLVVQRLLADARVDLNVKDQRGNTILMHAFETNDVGLLKWLLATKTLDVSVDTITAAFAQAVYKGHEWTVRLLMADARVNPTAALHGDRNTPLHVAALQGHAAIVKQLLSDARVNPNARNGNGDTALLLAVTKDDKYVVKLLLADTRVDPNISNQAGDTALSRAAEAQDKPALLELLLADGRTARARPLFSLSSQTCYDRALRNVKQRRNARFRGLVRFVLVLKPMRLRAATNVYAPGGAGFAAAAASFHAAAVHLRGSSHPTP